jgi:putative transposase
MLLTCFYRAVNVVVLDLYSRLVIGWGMTASGEETLVEQALRLAVFRRRPQAD